MVPGAALKSGEGVVGDHRVRKGPTGIPLEEFLGKTKRNSSSALVQTHVTFFLVSMPTAPLFRNTKRNLECRMA